MKKVSNNSINISKGSNGGYVEEKLIECVKDIITTVRMEFEVEYNDVTYKDLYSKTVQFAKEVDEILSSEITQRDDLFNTTPDYFSFRNDKLI